MATLHERRVLFLVPAARRTALNNWFSANIAEAGPTTFTVGLSPSGSAPPTHYVCWGAWTEPEMRLMARRLAQDAGLPLPEWQAMSRAEKTDWIRDNRQAIAQATGVRFRVDRQEDAEWPDPLPELAAVGLKVVA